MILQNELLVWEEILQTEAANAFVELLKLKVYIIYMIKYTDLNRK